MTKNLKLKKGFTINLAGKAELKTVTDKAARTYAIKPTDFKGMARPKPTLKEGDSVKAGTPILFDKMSDKVMFTSPVSGEIAEIVRGEKRKLLEIRILADDKIEYEEFDKYTLSDLSTLKKESIIEQMTKSGVWPNIIQRPYGIIADPSDTPKSIFVSTFDTHPLAPDYDYLFKNDEKYFQAGVDILKKLTKGGVHVNLDGNAEVSQVFSHTKNATLNTISGIHPAGNVGVQIHHIDPVNKGDVVWTVNPFGVIQIGKLFLEGIYDASKLVAITGSEVKSPQYYKTYLGANIEPFLENNLNSDHVRVISGNVLTGEKIEEKGYIGYYDHHLTVIPEGDRSRFFLKDGWLAPTTSRLSFHKALGLLSFLNPRKEYKLDSSMNGEERAFVVTGAFEKVVPMDILPTYLIKAIMAGDYDEMEALGIYEVIEEDLALCEFIDVSKHDIQALVREGIDLVRE